MKDSTGLPPVDTGPDPSVLAAEPAHWHGMAGQSNRMQALRQAICRVAPTDAAVFLDGESGVGKELVAAAIHRESARSGPFVALNCGAVPTELLTSQLFGHEKGSFTGAHSRQLGLFQQADAGTLFLDEISEMPLNLQVHLLRALETRSIRRIGGDLDIAVDVRIIAATNLVPDLARRHGRLREDLYYRLAEFPLHVPALRERADDIAAIANLFLARLNSRYQRHCVFAPGVVEQLRGHAWPGNIRELKNVVHRAFILAEAGLVRPELPCRRAGSVQETANTLTFAVGTSLEEMERLMLLKTLAYYQDNKARTAAVLGISTRTIHNRLAQYERQATPRLEPAADFSRERRAPGERQPGAIGRTRHN
jgi:DNA-binding NtrC family response regulator